MFQFFLYSASWWKAVVVAKNKKIEAFSMEHWMTGTGSTAIATARQLNSYRPQLMDSDDENKSVADPRLGLITKLHDEGYSNLAKAVLPPVLEANRCEVELRLLMETRRERGGAIGIGLIGLPPAISYSLRFGETEAVESALSVVVESFPLQKSENSENKVKHVLGDPE